MNKERVSIESRFLDCINTFLKTSEVVKQEIEKDVNYSLCNNPQGEFHELFHMTLISSEDGEVSVYELLYNTHMIEELGQDKIKVLTTLSMFESNRGRIKYLTTLF